MRSLFGAPSASDASVPMQRDEVRASLRRDPTSMSISWMIQPMMVDGTYSFSKYYESSSFVHSINYLRLEFSLILRETRDNTMGFFIECKNLNEGMSLSMQIDFVMKIKEDFCTYRSYHKTKTEYFILDRFNNCRGIFNFCDTTQLDSFLTRNQSIPYVILSVNLMSIASHIAAPSKTQNIKT